MISRHIIRRLAPLVLAVVLAACGQKGALYLPDGDRPQQVERLQPAPDTAADRSNEPRKRIH